MGQPKVLGLRQTRILVANVSQALCFNSIVDVLAGDQSRVFAHAKLPHPSIHVLSTSDLVQLRLNVLDYIDEA